MVWVTSCLGFFGFLRAGEFTTNSSFDPSLHLAVSDIQADALVDPSCFRVYIKSSKTDPLLRGCVIYVDLGNSSICPVAALGNFLALRGLPPGPLFCFADGRPLTRQQLSSNGAVHFTLGGLSWFLLGSQLLDWGGYESCGAGSSESPH